jgi:hypothetical protein
MVELRPVPRSYFEGSPEPCPKCSKPLDVYEMIFQALMRGGFDFWVLAAVGARLSIFSLTLQPREMFHLRLTDYQVPADARVLGISYTCQWSEPPFLFPVEMHGNRPIKYAEPMERE